MIHGTNICKYQNGSHKKNKDYFNKISGKSNNFLAKRLLGKN
jgi:hypothetical protein